MRRRRSFTASLVLGGFTPCCQRELRLRGLLVRGPSETHGWSALPAVRPFASLKTSDLSGASVPGRLLLRYYGLC